MEHLITLIGNAAVDPNFRRRFLDDPVDTVDHYGFLLSKGDFELMQTIFCNLTPAEKDGLNQAFSGLEHVLYIKVPCTPPCHHSVYPPAEYRLEVKKVA